jgi:hypothetical protein
MVYEISKSFSKMVYEDGIEAYKNPNHPCHHFVDYQKAIQVSPFQLPEPFSGRTAELGLVFLSLNPSINALEDIPSVDPLVRFDTYDNYFRFRFEKLARNKNYKLKVPLSDGTFDKATLWNNIEKFGTEYLGSLSQDRFILAGC